MEAVPLTSRLRTRLKTLKRNTQPTDPVFPGWDKDRAGKAWRAVRKSIGLAEDTEAVLHSMRHTCASRLVQKGTPIQVVQQWLGHKTLTMTLRYAHLAPVNLLNAVQALEPAPEETKTNGRKGKPVQAGESAGVERGVGAGVREEAVA